MNSTEDDDEEQIFIVELSGLMESDLITKHLNVENCKLIGVDSERPVLKVGPHVFLGSWEHVVGTNLIFQDVGDTDSLLKYEGKSTFKLSMKKAVVTRKDCSTTEEEVGGSSLAEEIGSSLHDESSDEEDQSDSDDNESGDQKDTSSTMEIDYATISTVPDQEVKELSDINHL